MKKLKWSKVLAGCLTAAMTVSLVPTGSILAEGEAVKKDGGYSVVDASALNVDVDFYDYNITTYKGKEVDKDKIALNAYQKETFVTGDVASGSGITEKNLFLFGGDRTDDGKTGLQNIWTTFFRTSQYQGIVKDSLDENGNLVFNNEAGIYSVNIFPQEGETELEEAGVVETYYNTNFQFLNEDGTYQYDSSKHASYGLHKEKGKNVLYTDLTKPGPSFTKDGNGPGKGHKEYGFFPFNNVEEGSYKADPDSRHHMFGMKMELDFYMPENGEVELESDSSKKNPMVFEFSGDDDVWVFVDGHLVLDLGGIHDATGGKINFKDGQVTYTGNNSSGVPTKVKNIYNAYSDIDQSAYSEHTLTMFYLERGEYDSNCKITFNIPTVVTNEDISITKKVENAPENNTDTYDFKLLYGNDIDNLTKVYKGTYQLYDSSKAYLKDVETKKDGVITLAAGETAVIDKDKIKGCRYYMVQEINTTEEYDTSWIVTGENGTAGDGEQTKVMEKNSDNSGSHIEFTNEYHIPEPTQTPEVTTAPGITATPEVTTSPEATQTPEVTGTPEQTDKPKVTATPFVTKTPPTSTGNPAGRKTPVPQTNAPNTETPTTKAPETEVPATKVPTTSAPETEIPTTKAPETETPVTKVPETETPSTKVPNTKVPTTKVPEVEIPDGDIPQDAPATASVAPKNTPVVIVTSDIPSNPSVTVTNQPVGDEAPATTEVPSQVVDEDTDFPGDPAGVSTKKPQRTPDEKDTPKTTKKPDKTGTIIEDDIPGELPQTGGIGVFEKKTASDRWLIVVPVLLFAAGSVSVLVRRKKRKK